MANVTPTLRSEVKVQNWGLVSFALDTPVVLPEQTLTDIPT